MPLVRVPVSGTIGKAVRIDPDATIGACIGRDLFLPDCTTIPTLAELAEALYDASPPTFITPTSSGTVGPIFESDIIDGNIYARIAADEIITGAYTFKNAAGIVIQDAGGTDSIQISHDGLDLNFSLVNTQQIKFTGAVASYQFDRGVAIVSSTSQPFTTSKTGAPAVTVQLAPASLVQSGAGAGAFLFSGMTNIVAGTVDVDWDAITATSYGGILEVNLLDKSANEAIAGSYTFNGATFYSLNLRMDNAILLKGLNSAASLEFDIAQVSSGNNVIFGDNDVLTRIRGTSVSVDTALTATSYNGILAANLLDKTAAETITESWIWSGSADTITFTGGGPFGIQFRSVQSTTVQQIDLVYRTSPDTLAFERTSDAVKIIEINAATLAVDFGATITATSYDGILAANLLDKSAAETIAGAYTITGGLTLTTNNLVAGTIDADFDAITGTSISTERGTEALPSRSFEGDSDTGDYSPGANIYAITVGGTEAVRYTGSSAPLIRTGMNSGITASTTQTQGQQPLTASWNEVAVVANNNDVVTLPADMTTGEMCVVINSSAKKLQVFPASGKDCGAGIDTSLTIKGNSSRFWFSYDNTVAFDIATDFEKLQNINVIGKSANDLLYFDGTDWTHTGGDLTWDGVTLTAVRLKPIKYLQHRTASTANLEDITNAVNTSGGKIQGAEVYNRDTDNPVYATGSSDGAVWVNGIGTTVHTPV